MAYMSGESGNPELYVRPFPEANKGKWQISTNGGAAPLWSPDGKMLFYRGGGSVMAVPVESEPTFKCGKPQVLFRDTYVPYSLENPYTWDISPDGKRFLMLKAVQPAAKAPAAEAPRKINIVLNWLEELKQRVPVK
jgi:hypothetical protein